MGANAGETIGINIGTAMGSTGLGVSGVDVTAVGPCNPASSPVPARCYDPRRPPPRWPRFDLRRARRRTDFSTGTGTVASYERLAGTLSFGGKSFDLGSVDYSAIDHGHPALAALNAAATSALGLTTRPRSRVRPRG